MMLRARPQFDGALAVVAFFHGFTVNADARNISALPIMPLNIAVMSMAQFFPHSEITSAHAAYQGSSLPLITLVTFTLPLGSMTVTFWLVGRPLSVLYIVFVVMDLPSFVRK